MKCLLSIISFLVFWNAPLAAPKIKLIGDGTIKHEAGFEYKDLGATATDEIEGDLTDKINISGFVEWYEVGTYKLKYNVKNSKGEVAPTVERVVKVEDTLPPEIELPSHLENITHEAGKPFNIIRIVAYDINDGIIKTTTEGDINRNRPGRYKVIYRAWDASGNAAEEKIMRIHVIDSTKPVLIGQDPNPLFVEAGNKYTIEDINIVLSRWRAKDEFDGDLTGRIKFEGKDLINPDKIGTYTVIITVEDFSKNKALATQTFKILDTTKPVIILNGRATIAHEAGTKYIDLGVTAKDSLDGDLSKRIKVDSDVNINKLGSYKVKYYGVIDNSGNEAWSVYRVVVVQDTTPPELLLKGMPITMHKIDTPYVDPGAFAEDFFEGDLSGAIVKSGFVNSNEEGTYFIKYSVSDSSGNNSEATRKVIVGSKSLEIKIKRDAKLRYSFRSTAGTSYIVEISNDLENWITLESISGTGETITKNFPISNNNSNIFLRLKI